MLDARKIEGVLFAVALATAFAACGSVTAVQDGGAGQGGSAAGGAAGSASGAAGSASGAAGSAGGSSGTAGDAADGGAGRDAGDAATDAPGNTCHGRVQAGCQRTVTCEAAFCPACDGGVPTYLGCYQPSTEAAPACPGVACPVACAQVTTLDACEARTDCHSVFQDPGTCGCAGSGCCAHFSRCADGDKAACTGTPLCKIATPFCESPYVVAHTGSCYEGCVQKKDCAP